MSDDLDLTEVVKSFGDASGTLEALGERLRAISLAEATATEQSQSLSDVAAAARSLLEKLINLISTIREALPPLVDALETGRSMIASADLGPMQADLATLRSEMESQSQSLEQRLGEFGEALADNKELSQQLSDAESRYADLIGKLTPRQRAKLGL